MGGAGGSAGDGGRQSGGAVVKRIFRLWVVTLGWAIGSMPTVNAQSAVCSMFSNAALQRNQQIYVRQGVTAIDFNPAGETVRHVEVSNPDKVSINFDGDIDSGYATTVFLRPVTGVTIPHLPQSPTTQVMVLTQDGAGQRKTYPFQLVYAPNGSDCSVWSIYPDTDGLPTIELADRRRVPVEYVTMGLAVAARDGSLPYDNPLRQRVESFLALVENGERVLPAAEQAGVSVAVVRDLAQKGYDDYRSGAASES
ncbi:MAG: hypothetical protein AAF974_00040 [Cyanobacteria bacterium P01_E01_bin.34]